MESGLTWAAVAGLALTSMLIELTPGPNMAYLAIIGTTEGRRPGYAAVAGVALGLIVVGIAAALGLAAVIAASPTLYQVLRWGGVGYLLFLAWEGWRGAGETVDHAEGGSSLWRYFQRGLLTNLLNPKAAIFYVAVLPTFIVAGAPVVPQALILTLIYVGVATVVHLAVVTLAGAAKGRLEDRGWTTTVRRVLSLGLVGVALWMVVKTA